MAGLKAGRDLAGQGQRILILEKSRGVGGRAATRRWEGNLIDHGAQFFTVRDPVFRRQVELWRQTGICFEWCRGFHQWKEGRLLPPDPLESHPRFAATGGMSALGKNLAMGLDIRLQHTVRALRRNGGHWEGVDDEGRSFAAKTLLITAPPPQSILLLETLGNPPPDCIVQLRNQSFAPALAVMAAYPEQKPPDWNGIQAADDIIDWIGLNSGKHPPPTGQTVVIHGSPEFSRTWQDQDLEEAGGLLLRRAGAMAGGWLEQPTAWQIHRWRHARALNPSRSRLHGTHPELPGLFLAGDGFAGGKLEGAFLSGRVAAEAILADLADRW